ncbi:hypothetical protein CsSME_00043597 [Camellia sinensis var. sinensis]
MSDQVGKGERPSLRAPSLLDLHICHDLMHLIPNKLRDILPIIKLKIVKSPNESIAMLLLKPQMNDMVTKKDIDQLESGGKLRRRTKV